MTQRREFLNIEHISDDDCGMYRIGEIDWMPNNKVKEYVLNFGEFGYHEILNMCAQIMAEARQGFVEHNLSKSGTACEKST